MSSESIRALETLVAQLEDALRAARKALDVARANLAVSDTATPIGAPPKPVCPAVKSPVPLDWAGPTLTCPECKGSRTCIIAGVEEDCWTCDGRGVVKG